MSTPIGVQTVQFSSVAVNNLYRFYFRPRSYDQVKALRPTRHELGHFDDVVRSQSLGLLLKKLNPTKIKQHINRVVYANITSIAIADADRPARRAISRASFRKQAEAQHYELASFAGLTSIVALSTSLTEDGRQFFHTENPSLSNKVDWEAKQNWCYYIFSNSTS